MIFQIDNGVRNIRKSERSFVFLRRCFEYKNTTYLLVYQNDTKQMGLPEHRGTRYG